MKYFKCILDLVTIFIVTSLLIVFCLEEDKEKIANTNQIVNISSWDGKQYKKSVFDFIESYAQKHNFTIYKSQVKHQGKNYTRQTYVFNLKHDTTLIQSFDTEVKNERVSRTQLNESDVKGHYYFKGDQQQAIDFVNALSEKGVTAELYNMNTMMIFIQVLLDKGIFISLVGLMFIYILYYLQKRTLHFKEYALKKLNGYSNLNLVLMELPRSILKWSCLLCITFLLTIFYLWFNKLDGQLGIFIPRLIAIYCVTVILMSVFSLFSFIMLVFIDIPLMIKGVKPYLILRVMANGIKVIMVVLISILVVQNAQSFTKLKELDNVSNIWNKLDDYYFLEIQNLEMDEKKEQAQDEKFYNFVKSQNKHGAILLKSNSENHFKSNRYDDVQNGNYMIVNRNFLIFYQRIDNKIPGSDKEKVIISSTIADRESQIKKAITKWNAFQSELGANTFQPTMRVLDGDYQIYSFDLRTDDKFKFVKNPIILALNENEISPNFYKASISQGDYLFKDVSNIKKDLKRFGLENDISGITKYTDQVQSDIQEIQFKTILSTITILISILILSFAIVFEIQQYFDQKRKYLLLRKMNGFTVFQNYKRYFISSNGLILLILILLIFWLKTLLVLFIGVSILVLQIMIHIICIFKLEREDLNIIKEL